MGYTCVDGEIVIVPEQAEVARKIFDLYLQGLTLGQIKAYLESQGIKTVTGKDIWDTKTIQRMLANEKYKGDTMLQKTFTEDFMTGKKGKKILDSETGTMRRTAILPLFHLKYSTRYRKKWLSVQGLVVRRMAQ